MGRNAKFNREEALDFAMTQIWSNGYASTSVKTLSEQLGITRSSFYNAFGSREAMFREAIARYFESTPDNMWKNLPEDSQILPVITAVFRRICYVLTQLNPTLGCMEANSIAALVGTNDRLGEYLASALHSRVDHIERLLQIAARNGEISDDIDIKATALTLQSHILGLSLLSKVVTDEDKLWAVARCGLVGLGLYHDPHIKKS